MKVSLLVIAVVAGACSDSTSGASLPAVTCDGANISTQAGNCTIDFGVCSDEKSYLLACTIGNAGLSCTCEIENVSSTTDFVNLAGATCDATLMEPELVQAWLDCGIRMTLSS
ncbi:MAG TPA: hypothetical protein VMJ10_29435 [Kofleriaceae bacterium]|nr:hypothetical protein [Kofleriaceae bacterium]